MQAWQRGRNGSGIGRPTEKRIARPNGGNSSKRRRDSVSSRRSSSRASCLSSRRTPDPDGCESCGSNSSRRRTRRGRERAADGAPRREEPLRRARRGRGPLHRDRRVRRQRPRIPEGHQGPGHSPRPRPGEPAAPSRRPVAARRQDHGDGGVLEGGGRPARCRGSRDGRQLRPHNRLRTPRHPPAGQPGFRIPRPRGPARRTPPRVGSRAGLLAHAK